MKLMFNKGPLFYTNYNVRLFIFLLFHKADVLVSNDLDTLLSNFLASKIKRATLVYDSHEYFTEVPELIHRKKTQRIWENIEKRILPKIKYSYTVCGSIAEVYNKKYGIDMQVVRNIPFLKKTIAEIPLNLHTGNKKNILYQGAVNIGRGLELMIETIQLIENAVFIIVGEGDIYSDLKKQVQESGLEEKVIFTGKVHFEQLHSLTKQAHLGISLEENRGLNYYYALPNKIFDYIHAEVPLLTSDFPEMKKIVEGYKVGITTNLRDAEKLASLIKNMLSDTKKRKEWISNTKKAAQELCWEQEEKKLIDIFENTGLKFNKPKDYEKC